MWWHRFVVYDNGEFKGHSLKHKHVVPWWHSWPCGHDRYHFLWNKYRRISLNDMKLYIQMMRLNPFMDIAMTQSSLCLWVPIRKSSYIWLFNLHTDISLPQEITIPHYTYRIFTYHIWLKDAGEESKSFLLKRKRNKTIHVFDYNAFDNCFDRQWHWLHLYAVCYTRSYKYYNINVLVLKCSN